ncbi:MAG: hypothetical protein KDK91_00725 [Gammaproteobacteria bacterium]|nr:hypothetical protein [Gammaproteobacteria bacterium]
MMAASRLSKRGPSDSGRARGPCGSAPSTSPFLIHFLNRFLQPVLVLSLLTAGPATLAQTDATANERPASDDAVTEQALGVVPPESPTEQARIEDDATAPDQTSGQTAQQPPARFGEPGDTRLILRPGSSANRFDLGREPELSCFRFGPLPDHFTAIGIELELDDRGLQADSTWTGAATSWGVFSTPQPAGQRASGERRLRELGLTDFSWLDKPPYAGRFSAGVFRSRDNALRRQTELQRSGLRFVLVPRGEDLRHWVQVMAPTYNGESVLRGIARRHEVPLERCPAAQR